jgi:hypothetical protein|tara:strand:- start:303 stop:1247 length:945 start_codon:yes stop_codon:yes gene_type:complete
MSRPKNLVCYTTEKTGTTKIVQKFAAGVASLGSDKWTARVVNIGDFKSSGHPPDTDAIATLGILRGTGLALQSAAAAGIDRYYIDHAYFNPGYASKKNIKKGWMRITKNKHTMNTLPKGEVSSENWKANFKHNNPIHAWKTRLERGDRILVLPPSNAIQWYFNVPAWEEQVVSHLRRILPIELHKLIKVRRKPKEPIVDKLGNLLRLDTSVEDDSVTLEEDLLESNVVVAYNSMVALKATLMGIPVITNQHNCCYPISFKVKDIQPDMSNLNFDVEPNRTKLVRWLSQCQFSNDQIHSGIAWTMLQENNNAINI